MPKIVHYRENCIGCGACIACCPNTWEMSNEDGKADLKGAEKKKNIQLKEVDRLEAEENKQAAESCPVNIIKILK
ncbi:MAG: ferredoxin [Candidatus Woesearchaeota archaeon]